MSGLAVGSVCSGYGGLDMAVCGVLGGEVRWVADNAPAAGKVLAYRFPGVPNLGDIATADWDQVPPVDVVCGGFPCTDVSVAGSRSGMLTGNRSGVWAYQARAIAVLRPRLVVIENVRGLLSAKADSNVEWCPWCLGDTNPQLAVRALGAVLSDLAVLGFDAEWVTVPASAAGAPHGRSRVFILAWRAAADAEHDGYAAGPDPGTAQGDAGEVAIGLFESAGSSDQQPATADAGRARLGKHPGESSAQETGPVTGHELADHRGLRAATDWGPYQQAIRRWERRLGRSAPLPTVPGPAGERLNPRLSEWMMGLPDGWVTDVPGLSYSDQITLLGNGVVPQQAALGLRLLLGRLEWDRAA